MTRETVTNQPKAEMDRAARLSGLTVRGEREKASMDARKFQQSLHALAITETAEGGRTEFSTYQAQDHGEGKIEDSLPEGFWERGVMFPMKDAGTQIEIRRLKEDHGEGEG
jgi:hypothetical protein